MDFSKEMLKILNRIEFSDKIERTFLVSYRLLRRTQGSEICE